MFSITDTTEIGGFTKRKEFGSLGRLDWNQLSRPSTMNGEPIITLMPPTGERLPKNFT